MRQLVKSAFNPYSTNHNKSCLLFLSTKPLGHIGAVWSGATLFATNLTFINNVSNLIYYIQQMTIQSVFVVVFFCLFFFGGGGGGLRRHIKG